MKPSTRIWRTLLFCLLLAALCGSFALPLGNTPVGAAPNFQATSCTGIILAQWDFTGSVITPSTGSGTLSYGSGVTAPTFPGGQTTAENPAISFSGFANQATSDPNDYIEFAASTLGGTGIGIMFKSRVTNTGPTLFDVHYSADGTNFVLFDAPYTLQNDTAWYTISLDLSTIPGVDDNPNAKFRFYPYSASGATGAWRLDNVVFCGMPIVTIDSIAPNPTNGAATVTWHASVNGNYEIRLGGTSCTDGTVVGSGAYTTSPATIPSVIDGTTLVEGANAIRVCLIDALTHTHFASSSVTRDTTAPTVTLNQASGQADPANALPINFAVVFSEAINVSTFAASDITQTGTAAGITWTITDTGDHRNFTLAATAVTSAGTLIPTIAAGAVTDVIGNNNIASTSTDNSVNYVPAAPLVVIINEVAWSGTSANSDDEWIELFNPSTTSINITGWRLYGDDNTLNTVGSPNILLSGTIPSGGYFLLERNEQATDVTANQVYSSGDLLNTGERLYLKDASGNIIDTANLDGGAWPAGTAGVTTTTPPAYASMERVGTTSQWVTYAGTVDTAHNRNGGPIKGTPGRANWISTATITTITSDTPDPSLANQNVTVTVTVIGGTTTPTGTVAITGANTNCTITLASGTGSCQVKFTSVGAKTLTATYGGDSTHPPSNDTESHQVSTTITPFRTPTPIPPPPPQLVVINEFVPRPGHDWNNDGVVNVGDEYIELLNHGTVDVNLSGYRLDDEVNIGSDPYSLPSKVLKPGERIVYYGSETGLLLGDGGDGVRLLKPNGQLMDAFNYFVVEYPDQSYCRLPDNGGADDWNKYCYPTPGLQNSLSAAPAPPSLGPSNEPLCPIADTLPYDFAWAECEPFGNNIWRAAYWDLTGWYDERNLPDINSKWPVFAD